MARKCEEVTHDPEPKRDCVIGADKKDAEDNSETPSLHEPAIASLLKRVEQLEAMSGSKPTRSSPETATEPSEDGISMYVDMYKNKSGGYDETNGQRPTDNKEVRLLNPPYVLTTYWSTHEKGTGRTREKSMLEIRSEPLIRLMRDTMQKMIAHENASVWMKSQVIIPTTQKILGHCYHDLRAVAEEQGMPREGNPEDRTVRDDLTQLLNDLKCIEPENVHAEDFVKNEQAASYERLWSLFSPGSEVIGWVFQESPQIFIVHRAVAHKDPGRFVITCWAYDWDGAKLVRLYYEFTILEFQGSRSVTDLPCYPLSFYGNQTELKNDLIERGKRFRDYCIVSQPMRLYRSNNFFTLTLEGKRELNIDILSMLMSGSGGVLVEYKSSEHNYDIIIDAALCRRYRPGSYQMLGDMKAEPAKVCDCALCDLDGFRKRFEESFISGDFEIGVGDRMYQLLPPRVRAYLLGRKQWGQVLVNGITTWETNEPLAAWKKLSIAQKHKENIMAMVSAYFKREGRGVQDRVNIVDPIPGKGEGLIILLHGIPGVGKTMMAETLATSLGRRLLRIDGSDFEYNNAGQVSEAFKRYFHMASSWGALLLLDEADVFLQYRTRHELNQNALVSVLLRELEYFRGVLIMTTNRIVSVDYAVQSRIHYAVKFLQLGEGDVESIWNNFRLQLTDENSDSKERENIDRWFNYAKIHLTDSKFTGRDIRNVFMCAQLLGYPKVTCENIRKAAESTTSFRRDLEKAHQKLVSQNTVVED